MSCICHNNENISGNKILRVLFDLSEIHTSSSWDLPEPFHSPCPCIGKAFCIRGCLKGISFAAVCAFDTYCLCHFLLLNVNACTCSLPPANMTQGTLEAHETDDYMQILKVH